MKPRRHGAPTNPHRERFADPRSLPPIVPQPPIAVPRRDPLETDASALFGDVTAFSHWSSPEPVYVRFGPEPEPEVLADLGTPVYDALVAEREASS